MPTICGFALCTINLDKAKNIAHDKRRAARSAEFAPLDIKAFRPDAVCTIGDEIDLPQISRWTENTPGWYEQTLASDRDHTVEVLWKLTEHVKEAHMVRSNHTDRLYNVIMKKIPAFLSLPELKFEKFLKLDELGITFHKEPFHIAKGWIAIHGDLGALNPNPGMSALNQARRHGLNVIMGHTHRAFRTRLPTWTLKIKLSQPCQHLLSLISGKCLCHL